MGSGYRSGSGLFGASKRLMSAATTPPTLAHPHARIVLFDFAEPTEARLPLWPHDYKPR
jgi:hypothetical protein